MRGAAILFVLLSHITAKILPLSMARWFTPFGGTGVAVFLFLSGYGLTIRYKDSLKGYWYNRFMGTFLPYLLLWGATIWMHQYDSFGAFIADILAIYPQTSYFWYLGYLAIWYIAFFTAHRFLKNPFLRYSFYLLISLLVLFFGRDLWAEQAFIFPLGCFLSESFEVSQKINNTLAKRAMLFAAAFALVGIGCLAVKQLSIVREAPHVLFALVQMLIKTPLALCVILVSGVITSKTVRKILSYFGSLSYELYLIHSVTIEMFDHSCIDLFVAIPLFAVVTVALSYALKWLCKGIKGTIKNIGR